LSFETNLEEFSQWKSFASSLGLEPSIGKNYLSDRWYTIDSALFVEGKRVPNIKWKWLRNPGPKEISQVQSILGTDMTKYFLNHVLKYTSRSLEVDYDQGGLAINGREPQSHLEKVIALGRQLTRLPKSMHGQIVLRQIDVCKDDIEVEDIRTPFDFAKPSQESDRFCDEKQWMRLESKYSETLPSGYLNRFISKPRKLGPKRHIVYDEWRSYEARVCIMNDLFDTDVDPMEQIPNFKFGDLSMCNSDEE